MHKWYGVRESAFEECSRKPRVWWFNTTTNICKSHNPSHVRSPSTIDRHVGHNVHANETILYIYISHTHTHTKTNLLDQMRGICILLVARPSRLAHFGVEVEVERFACAPPPVRAYCKVLKLGASKSQQPTITTHTTTAERSFVPHLSIKGALLWVSTLFARAGSLVICSQWRSQIQRSRSPTLLSPVTCDGESVVAPKVRPRNHDHHIYRLSPCCSPRQALSTF